MPKTINPSSKHNTPVSVLQSIATITCQRDRDLLAQSLVSTLAELIHSLRITMYRTLPNEQGEEAILVAECLSPSAPTSTPSELSVFVATRADFQRVLQTAKEHVESLDEFTIRHVFPIAGKHNTVGLLEIIAGNGIEIDQKLIVSFLMIYSNYLNILDESETDTLTGLLNRRTFENNMERIIANERAQTQIIQPELNPQHPARRQINPAHPHWLAVMDIDHFKRINDQFGHLYGDEVLILLSRKMKRIFRQTDKLFRFGGEEFIVVLERTSLDCAKKVLERFRSGIENFNFPQVGKVTISIGFVRLDKIDVPSAIVGRADQALYYAKEHGRNQVCFYEELVSEGKLAAEHFSDDLELF
ncbi:MAG: GGDEF domain-containing protein [Gallionella sp.]|jgi:diguanylate cyclase (GGDEF)-like protein